MFNFFTHPKPNRAMSSEQQQQDLSDAMAEGGAETRRRQRATITGGESTLDDQSGYTREFQAADQKYVLWNMANTGLTPRSVKPAFRIVGLFADEASALRHAKRLMDDPHTDKTSALRLSTTHEWYTIPKNNDRDPETCTAAVNRNLLHHQSMLQDHAHEFKARHDALTEGRTPALLQAKAAVEQIELDDAQRVKQMQFLESIVDGDGKKRDPLEIQRLKDKFQQELGGDAEKRLLLEAVHRVGEGVEEEKGGEAEAAAPYVDTPLVAEVKPEVLLEKWDGLVDGLRQQGGVESHNIPRVFDLRGQTYAVVSVVADYETKTREDPFGEEPGVIVWAAFDTEEEALKYNKNVAAKKLRDHDLAIVSMYEWLYPHMMNSDRVNQLYRNEELNNIMKHARTSSTQVSEFEEKFRENGKECPTMTLEPDLTEPAPHRYQPPVGSAI